MTGSEYMEQIINDEMRRMQNWVDDVNRSRSKLIVKIASDIALVSFLATTAV